MKRLSFIPIIMFATYAVVAQWTQTYGPPAGGHIFTMTTDGSNIFAGAYGGGVYYSENNGESWIRVNTGLSGFHIVSLAANATRVFAGVNEGSVVVSANQGGKNP